MSNEISLTLRSCCFLICTVVLAVGLLGQAKDESRPISAWLARSDGHLARKQTVLATRDIRSAESAALRLEYQPSRLREMLHVAAYAEDHHLGSFAREIWHKLYAIVPAYGHSRYRLGKHDFMDLLGSYRADGIPAGSLQIPLSDEYVRRVANAALALQKDDYSLAEQELLPAIKLRDYVSDAYLLLGDAKCGQHKPIEARANWFKAAMQPDVLPSGFLTPNTMQYNAFERLGNGTQC